MFPLSNGSVARVADGEIIILTDEVEPAPSSQLVQRWRMLHPRMVQALSAHAGAVAMLARLNVTRLNPQRFVCERVVRELTSAAGADPTDLPIILAWAFQLALQVGLSDVHLCRCMVEADVLVLLADGRALPLSTDIQFCPPASLSTSAFLPIELPLGWHRLSSRYGEAANDLEGWASFLQLIVPMISHGSSKVRRASGARRRCSSFSWHCVQSILSRLRTGCDP